MSEEIAKLTLLVPLFEEGRLVCSVEEAASIGHVVVMEVDGHGEICDMWVKPEYRGWHYGSRLLETAIQWLRDRGCEDVVLHVETDNKVALHLYRKAGFTETRKEYHMRRLLGE